MLESIESAASIRLCPEIDLHDTAQELANDVGMPYYSYLSRWYESQQPAQQIIFSHNYPESWVTRYLQRGYQRLDPVVEHSAKVRAPFFWGQGDFLSAYEKPQRRVFDEARAFEITEGYAIPIYGPDGECAVFSVCAARKSDTTDTVAQSAATLQLFAVQFHDQMMMRQLNRSDNRDVTLSHRERECLAWTADGLIADDVGIRLHISVSTVNYHLSNAIKKLRASNKYHAAILAIRIGVL